MLITLQRRPSFKGATIGDLYLDGTKECFTCEDQILEDKLEQVENWKIQDKTAIPEGKYRVVLTQSKRFKRVLPEILKVNGFVGVRIHGGNSPEDSSGCILVGEEAQEATITRSQPALLELMAAISMALDSGEQVHIEVKNPEA